MRLWRRSREPGFLDRAFLLATIETDLEPGQHVLQDALEVGFIGTETTDGHRALPAFTSEKRLVEWMPEGSPWIGLAGRDLLLLFLQGEWEAIVLDPSKPDGLQLDREQAERMLAAE